MPMMMVPARISARRVPDSRNCASGSRASRPACESARRFAETDKGAWRLSLIHISEPTRRTPI
eukprot:5389936-Pleurochrysis_carterae.AAC.1